MAPLNLEQDETKTNFPELDSHSMLNMFIISLKHHNHPHEARMLLLSPFYSQGN